MTRKCASCGNAIYNSERYCQNCGAPAYVDSPRQEDEFRTPSPSNPPALTTVDFIKILLLMMIPVVNLILLIIWAIDKGQNPNKRSYAKASLIVYLVGIIVKFIIAILFWIPFSGAITNRMNDNYDYHYYERPIEIPAEQYMDEIYYENPAQDILHEEYDLMPMDEMLLDAIEI